MKPKDSSQYRWTDGPGRVTTPTPHPPEDASLLWCDAVSIGKIPSTFRRQASSSYFLSQRHNVTWQQTRLLINISVTTSNSVNNFLLLKTPEFNCEVKMPPLGPICIIILIIIVSHFPVIWRASVISSGIRRSLLSVLSLFSTQNKF